MQRRRAARIRRVFEDELKRNVECRIVNNDMGAIKITYDNIGNTLDIWFTKPTKNIICDDLDSDTIVKRNLLRFTPDFMFQLKREEYNSLRSQIVTLEIGKGKHNQYNPYAFTEYGVAMLASVLKSEKAALTNTSIIRAFIALKQFALTYKDLAEQIAKLELKYNHRFSDVYEALELILNEKQKKDE